VTREISERAAQFAPPADPDLNRPDAIIRNRMIAAARVLVTRNVKEFPGKDIRNVRGTLYTLVESPKNPCAEIIGRIVARNCFGSSRRTVLKRSGISRYDSACPRHAARQAKLIATGAEGKARESVQVLKSDDAAGKYRIAHTRWPTSHGCSFILFSLICLCFYFFSDVLPANWALGAQWLYFL